MESKSEREAVGGAVSRREIPRALVIVLNVRA